MRRERTLQHLFKFKANYGPEEFASRDTIVGDERWFSKRVQCAKDAALGLV